MKTDKPTAHFQPIQQGCNRQAMAMVPLTAKTEEKLLTFKQINL
jgi:hypothetical protein